MADATVDLWALDEVHFQQHGAYSGEVNGMFQRDVNSRSGDENKVGAKLRWDCNHA